MSADLINRFDLVYRDLRGDHVGEVGPSIATHRGEVLVGDMAARRLEEPKPGMNVIIAFPSEDETMAFHQDPEDQPVKDNRLAATTDRAAVISPAFVS